MFDHVSLYVSDFERAVAFYEETLAPLGIKRLTPIIRLAERDPFAGYGLTRPMLWLHPAKQAIYPTHIAFTAENRASVRGFYQAGLAAGARDNGAPGVRPHYAPDYYGAFLLDADGHNIEAVTREPE